MTCAILHLPPIRDGFALARAVISDPNSCGEPLEAAEDVLACSHLPADRALLRQRRLKDSYAAEWEAILQQKPPNQGTVRAAFRDYVGLVFWCGAVAVALLWVPV